MDGNDHKAVIGDTSTLQQRVALNALQGAADGTTKIVQHPDGQTAQVMGELRVLGDKGKGVVHIHLAGLGINFDVSPAQAVEFAALLHKEAAYVRKGKRKS